VILLVPFFIIGKIAQLYRFQRLFGDERMNQFYYDAVTKMEGMGVNEEYIQGWQAGFLLNPKREEQRVTEEYETGYADGEEKNTDKFGDHTS